MARGAKAAHGFDDGIEQAEEDEGKVVLLKQESLGAARTLVGRWRHGVPHLGEPLPEIIQQFPTAEFFLVDCFLGATHTRRTSESVQQYK